MRVLGLLLLAGVALADPATELKQLETERDAAKLGYVEKYQVFKPRFEAFAQKHAGTDEALQAKLWLLQQCWWQRKDGTMTQAAGVIADEIFAEYGESRRLGAMVEYHYVFDAAQKKKYFARLLESKHREVVAAALFGSGRAGDKAALARLAKEFADVAWRESTYGAIADAYLHPHPSNALQQGRPAPEIEGVDENGRPMRLSDFKGKVILLDFWGDW